MTVNFTVFLTEGFPSFIAEICKLYSPTGNLLISSGLFVSTNLSTRVRASSLLVELSFKLGEVVNIYSLSIE